MDLKSNEPCPNLDLLESRSENQENSNDGVSSTKSHPAAGKVGRPSRLKKNASKNKTSKPTYTYDCHAKENHGNSIFDVVFNHCINHEDDPMIFATAGSNRCTVYECPKEGSLKLLMVYADPDIEEIFYTCAWSYDIKNENPLLAVAGYRGIIRVIDVVKNQAVGSYVGHGQAINQIKFHPRKPQLLLSASKDHAIRLWNTSSHVLIAIFGGVEGHRDEVLSIDFDIKGTRFMSSGMDHSLKLWRLDNPELQKIIQLSEENDANRSSVPFQTFLQHFPDYSTRDIHRNYVDCVQWFQDYILSKSCENLIVCWKPGSLNQPYSELKPSDSTSTVITEYEYDQCEMWFIRFGFNPWKHILAIGNQFGKVYVWELDQNEPESRPPSLLSNSRCNSIVRQIAFSKDASVLVYVCDDSTVWRWNRIKDEKEKF